MVTGSIQIKNGKYKVVLNLEDENGKRKQKWISTGLPVRGNKKAAEAFLHDELSKWNRHSGVVSNMLVADYFEHWLGTIKDEVRPNTYRGYHLLLLHCVKNTVHIGIRQITGRQLAFIL